MSDAEKLAAVREAIPALGAGIYLNTGSVGPMPAETAAAMAELSLRDRDLGRADQARFEALLERMGEARAAVAALVGADVDNVALTHSTTDGMNAASLLPDWRSGGRIVTTDQEHAGALGVLRARRDRDDIEVVMVDAADGDDDRMLAEFDAAIVPGTGLVVISHVLWTTGATLPVAAISAMAHERGALVVVDGAQAAGAIPFRIDELGADLYALSAQKWLLGPEAMGGLIVAPGLVDRLTPALGGWFSFEKLDGRGNGSWWDDARRFEWSDFHLPSVVGMARSIGWLSMYVGLDFIYRRGAAMAALALDRLGAIDGVDILTPRRSLANLVTFTIAGWSAEAALLELGARAFVIARSIPGLDAIRISPGFFTTDDEIARLSEAVGLLAAHTPATMPRRPGLTILGQG
jgi:L-cysteine/cystine lyase